MMKRIGGEFEINPNYLNFAVFEKYFLYSNGRSAFLAILLELNINNMLIYLPEYICESLINICLKNNISIKFYSINNSLQVLESYQFEDYSVVLIINYFGMIDNNLLIQKIKTNSTLTVIEDNVHSFWNVDKSIADYSFTSLRKTFAVPEGGLVYKSGRKLDVEIDHPINSFYESKLLGSILKYVKSEDFLYLNLFEKGEEKLDSSFTVEKSSNISSLLFSCIDLSDVAERRKENYKFLYEEGRAIGLNFIFNYNENDIPLFAPILVERREEIRKKMFKKNIFLPYHWPKSKILKSTNSFANTLYKNELSLIIDQRYSINEMQSIINILKEYV